MRKRLVPALLTLVFLAGCGSTPPKPGLLFAQTLLLTPETEEKQARRKAALERRAKGQPRGNTPSRSLVRYFNSQFTRVAGNAPAGDETDIFAAYNPRGPSVWAVNWTRNLDLTGIAWNGDRAGVLISPQHIVFAKHYPHRAGAAVVFHDRNGQIVRRRMVSRKNLKGGKVDDIAVGLLNKPVPPSIKVYKIFPAGSFPRYTLLGAKAVLTNKNRRIVVREINSILPGYDDGDPGCLVRFKPAEDLPEAMQPGFTSGDSGHPGFLIHEGELVLIETLTYGGYGRGPYFGNLDYQEQVMKTALYLSAVQRERNKARR